MCPTNESLLTYIQGRLSSARSWQSSCRSFFLKVVNQSRYNKSVDWYALGVLIFEMLSGLPPYHQPEPNPVLLYERIAAGPTFIRWPAFHSNARDLIMKLMESDPSRRYGNLRHGAGDVFAHPWFREVDWEKLRRREIMAPYMQAQPILHTQFIEYCIANTSAS